MYGSQFSNAFQAHFASIEEIVEEAQQGRVFILTDGAGAQSEGDLVATAQSASPDIVNFMAKNGRGLICLALDGSRVDQLGLPSIGNPTDCRPDRAFTVSIEAREGITTGISAKDRARTIAVAIDSQVTRSDLVSPGHIFPLRAHDGGVLARSGHSEAAVDIARLAGQTPAGVICKIMRDDGRIAKLDDLIALANQHHLKMATIVDLISYRNRHDRTVTRDVRELRPRTDTSCLGRNTAAASAASL